MLKIYILSSRHQINIIRRLHVRASTLSVRKRLATKESQDYNIKQPLLHAIRARRHNFIKK